MTPPDDRLAAELRGFGPVGIVAIAVILLGNIAGQPVSALLVLAWVWRSRTPWREIGYVRPRSWLGGLVIGIVAGCALKLVLKAIVMPLLGAEPVNHAYHYLVGNRAAIPGFALWLIVAGGLSEETIWRGYLFERLGKLLGQPFGRGARAKALIVVLTSLLFAAGHYADQGVAGAGQAVCTGLVFGTTFAVTGRIWTLMCMHAAYDLLAYAIIYWDLESRVAHLVFQ